MGAWQPGPGIIEFPDGRRVRGRGLSKPIDSSQEPELGVYLLGQRPPEANWPTLWIPWRDFGLPKSTEQAIELLQEAHRRAATQRVEIACNGGTGRTGTALSIMAILSGVPAEDAVKWVREHYRKRAVETLWQKRWVRTSAAALPL